MERLENETGISKCGKDYGMIQKWKIEKNYYYNDMKTIMMIIIMPIKHKKIMV